MDEIGEENINSLHEISERTLWNRFVTPFEAYGITEISDNFKSGASNTLELTKQLYQDNLKKSDNFKRFEKQFIDLVWPKIKSNYKYY